MNVLSLTLFQLVVFVLYIGMIIKNYGVLPSISESWYRLPLNRKALFTLFTWGMGIPTLLYGNVVFFIAGIGLIFVGAATQFKMLTANTKQIHYAGAYIGILGSLFGIWLQWGAYYPLILFLVSYLFVQYGPVQNKIWWIEMVAFASILLGMLVH